MVNVHKPSAYLGLLRTKHLTMQSPATDTEWTCLSVSAELREAISKQVAAGETYDEFLRENLSLSVEDVVDE